MPSWRLGNSLGVDLVEAPKNFDKICSFNCLYCQLGRKNYRLSKQKKFGFKEKELVKLKQKIIETKPDFITFSGEGEPTLNSNLGLIAKKIKKITTKPLAILTNGFLITQKKVREQLNQCDLVIVKIDAGNQELFEKINNPVKKINLKKIIEGIKKLKTKTIIQTLLFSFKTITNADEKSINELIKIYSEINKEKPIEIFLGTSYRPNDLNTKPVTEKQLKKIAKKISEKTRIKVTYYKEKKPKPIKRKLNEKELKKEIILLLERRPCTLKEIKTRFENNKTTLIINKLLKEKKILTKTINKKKYYLIK